MKQIGNITLVLGFILGVPCFALLGVECFREGDTLAGILLLGMCVMDIILFVGVCADYWADR